MQSDLRAFFDQHLEEVLSKLPPQIHQLMEEVPLIVDDEPTPQLRKRLRVANDGQLCGLYTGIPLTHRSVEHSGIPSDVIHIFRDGICQSALDRRGKLTAKALQEQIRITILHEVGHHFGLDEDDLRELGYG